ncbi:MAG: LPD7 domain-containing protein, partial [Nitrosomonas sp.]|nr:LPD7 domain-containing protein [Nitrosomonas sp.]
SQQSPVDNYKPSPADKNAESQYSRWMKAKEAFKPVKTEQLNELREVHKETRKKLRELHKAELAKIRLANKGHEKLAAVSVAKMKQSIEMAVLSEQISAERRDTYKQLKEIGPGSTFRDYLVKEAVNGDDSALAHAQKYGQDESTEVSMKRESDKLGIVATLSGHESKYTTRLPFTHRIERTGTVVFNFGQGRVITDSAISKQVQLNKIAASSPEAIATALQFATAKFGSTLTLNGSQAFQRLAVETSVLKGLGIKFADPALEAYREKIVAEQKLKFTQEKQNASNNRKQQTGRTPPPHRRDRLHDLSDSDLVLDTSGDVMLLREDVPHRVEQLKERPDHGMQRPASGLAGSGTGISQSEVASVPAEPVDVAKILEDWQAVPVSEARFRIDTRGLVKAVDGRYLIQDIGQKTHVMHQLAEGCKAPAVGSMVSIKNGVVTELARERADREFGRK